MAKKNYKVNESTRTVTADITAITEKERKEIQTLVDFGYTFKRNTRAKQDSPSKGKNVEWFKDNLSAEDFKKFEEVRASKKGITGFHEAYRQFIKIAEANAKAKLEETEKPKAEETDKAAKPKA